MLYRCFRATFNEADYQKYKTSFWAVAAAWANGNPPPLARWRKLAGDGVASVLPLIGRMACAERRHDFAFSIQEIARLGGADPGTVEKVRNMFAAEGIATTRVKLDEIWGQWLTHWSINSALCADRTPDSFFFHIRLLYGGIWAMMPAALRTIYLAAATKASVFHQPTEHWLYRDVLRPGVETCDIRRGYELVGGGRFALVSHGEISRICGVTPATVSKVAQCLKQPDVWPGSTMSRALIEYMPVWVYPTRGRTLLYHFRDHVPAWPWSVLQHQNHHSLSDADLTALLPAIPEYHIRPADVVAIAPEGTDNG
jgi:hypothetical protein